MMNFDTLDSLKEYLLQDSKKFSINPVRFINVESLEMWIEVKKLLLSLADETMPLSNFCVDSDTTPNMARLITAIKKVKRSVFVSPLSEYLRINPSIAEDSIKKIIKADYQNNENGKVRIYILMYRIKSVLNNISLDDPRTSDCITYLNTNKESDYQLTIVQKDLNISLPGNTITGFKNYLMYWESNPDKPLILNTNNAIYFEKNQFFDDVKVIVSSFGLMKDQHHIPAGLSEDLGSVEQWNELAKHIIQEGDLQQAFCGILSINRYKIELFEKWNGLNELQKWILWVWTRLQENRSYISECAIKSKSVKEFIETIYCEIINFVETSNYELIYNERRKVLKAIKSVPPDNFWNSISNLQTNHGLACLTDLSDIERKAVFSYVSDIKFEHRGNILKILKTVYPRLYYYLENDEQINKANLSQELYEYFAEYKWLKVTDTITDSFYHKVKVYAEQKGESIFVMSSRNHIITQIYDVHTAILFVDGMGVEYVDYLAHLFNELDPKTYTVEFDVGYCTLPSITEINKDFLTDRNTIEPPIRDLDELKHSNNIHPESLIKQFNLLDGIRERILGQFNDTITKIIIASDHGTSRLAVKVRNTHYDNVFSKPEHVAIYKYGRFCEDNGQEHNYPTAISINDKLIFADYSRFIQNGAPIDEIHGGASVEEWLVPIITIEKTSATKEIKQIVTIKPKQKKHKPEIGTKLIRVAFSVSGTVRKDLYVNINGNRIPCTFVDGYYNFTFKVVNKISNLLVKVIDKGIIGQFTIEIEQGIKQNEGFDI